jgi:hypothetical protein
MLLPSSSVPHFALIVKRIPGDDVTFRVMPMKPEFVSLCWIKIER